MGRRYNIIADSFTVFNYRDNTIKLILEEDDTAKDLSSITKIALVVDGETTIIDATKDAWPIKWDTSVTGQVILKLGDKGFSAGRHLFDIVLFDATNTKGIVWRDERDRQKSLFVVTVEVNTSTTTTTTTTTTT